MIDRRSFLKQMTILAGSATMVQSMPWIGVFNQPAAGRAASDRVRLGVIGMGDRGYHLAQQLQVIQGTSNLHVAAFCDDYEPNFNRTAELLGSDSKGYTDYRKMYDESELDGVLIATPLHEHARMTIEALERGMHVFCEKAMARTLADTKRMVDARKRTGRILQIGHQRMFNPVYLELMERIKRGEMGAIAQMKAYWHRDSEWRRDVPANRSDLDRRLNWRHYDEYSCGLWTELGSHHLQVANWIKDSQPVSVVARGSNLRWTKPSEVNDNIAGIFTFGDGMSFIFDCTNNNDHYGMQIHVTGSKATAELETNRYFTDEEPVSDAMKEMIDSVMTDTSATVPIGGSTWIPEVRTNYGGNEIVMGYDLDDTTLTMEAFVRFIREGSAPDELLVQGYRATVWALLASEAAKTGNTVTLPDEFRM
jgi:predicted dehydrogenase